MDMQTGLDSINTILNLIAIGIGIGLYFGKIPNLELRLAKLDKLEDVVNGLARVVAALEAHVDTLREKSKTKTTLEA